MPSGDKGENSWDMTTKGTDPVEIVEHAEGSLSEEMDGGSCSRGARRKLSVEVAKRMRASFDRQKDFLMVSGVSGGEGGYFSVMFSIQPHLFMYKVQEGS